ncbi:MAG: hypothetical protein ACK5HR_02050 [Mycoplasmatales bacterium]
MFLLTFDIIDSKQQEIKLIDVLKNQRYFNKLQQKYKINKKNFQINEGDQIRILVHENFKILELILETLAYLGRSNLKVRVFITKGELLSNDYQSLSELNADIFYQNKKLERETKADSFLYSSKSCIIRYQNTNNLIDSLFLSISRLSLTKVENIAIIYQYIYENKTQQQLAKAYEVSQMAISKKLKKSEIYVLKKLILEINELLQKEL